MPARAQWGELWWWESPHAGTRPVVVLSRNAALSRLATAIVAPCTTTVRGLPSEVLLEPREDPVPQVSAVNLDSLDRAPVALLVERLGRLSDDRMRQICRALETATGCQWPAGPRWQ